ncbi:MAG: response regulator [Chloroflexi bacterium]|nr:response regulator [Chloroflexota bacterium]
MAGKLTVTATEHLTADRTPTVLNTEPPALAPSILIVDDDADLRDILRLTLRRDGNQLIEAANGAAALAICQEQRLDLILLDIMMPVMDGVTACSQIRQLPGYADIPILMVTVLGDMDSITRSFEAGATDFIHKPINSVILRQRVQHLVRGARAQAALRDSEERYRLITENMSDAVWLMDLHYNLLYVSPAVERSLGYTIEEIRGLYSRRQLLTPASQKIVTQFFSRDLTPDNLLQPDYHVSRTLELEYYRSNGTSHWSELTLSLVRDPEGRPTGVLGVGRDITERKKAAEKILQLNADLTRRARELAALNMASQALTASLDLRQVLATVVREIQNLLNTEHAAVLLRDTDRDELVFAAVAGDNSERLMGVRQPMTVGIVGWVAREGQPVVVQDAEHDPRFWNGADTLLGYTTRAMLAVPIVSQQRVWGVVEAINRRDDVFSDQDRDLLAGLAASAAIAIENARLFQAEREHRKQLQESQARVIHAEKMSALGRLVASLTHEINNPLQAVQSGLYVLRESLDIEVDPAELREDLEIIEGEIRRIANLMQRLREFSRPVKLEPQPTDLHHLLENILQLVGKHLQQQRITAVKHWDSQLPRLLLNPDQLTQVAMNLVLNAIDAMPNGGTLTIVTACDRTRTSAPLVRLQVSDTGPGIPPEVLSHIFEPFFTTKATGTGLGLAISYEIVQSLGGEISALSAL